MIVEENLESTISKLSMIPEQERKIIIYVGTHPNEKTDVLIAPYEDRLKQYGVTIVKHPSELTPQAFWKEKQIRWREKIRKVSLSDLIFEEEVIKSIKDISPETFFIKFHGTDQLPKRLEIEIPQEAGRFSSLYESLTSLYSTTNAVFCKKRDYIMPGELVMEYCYSEKSHETIDRFTSQLLDRYQQKHARKGLYLDFSENPIKKHASRLAKFNDPHALRLSQISPIYLIQGSPNEEEIRLFHRRYGTRLIETVEIISQALGNK